MRRLGFVIISIIVLICTSCSPRKIQNYSINKTCDISVYIIKEENIKGYYSTKDISGAIKILSISDFTTIKSKKENDRVLFFAGIINKNNLRL